MELDKQKAAAWEKALLDKAEALKKKVREEYEAREKEEIARRAMVGNTFFHNDGKIKGFVRVDKHTGQIVATSSEMQHLARS